MDPDTSDTPSSNIPIDASLERTLLCDISGTMAEFEAGGHGAASWTIHTGKHAECFGIDEMLDHTADKQTVEAMLGRAVIQEVRVKDVKNEFPCGLGLTCSCIPSREMTASGVRFALTAPSKSYNPNEQVLFQAEETSEESSRWRQMYPKYSASNLETYNVLNVTGQPYVFVDQNHPVIQLLKDNADVLNADISQQPLIDGRWLKMTRQVLSSCCNTLRHKVLANCNTQDLNGLQFQIARVNAKDWTMLQVNDELLAHVPDDILISADENMIAKNIEFMQNKRYTFSARVNIKYNLIK